MQQLPNAAGQNAIASATVWLQGTLVGTLATAIAVVMVAWIGFQMLNGRIDFRRAAQIVLGCFIIFGASAFALGIFAVASGSEPSTDLAQASAPPRLPPTPLAFPNASASPFDPYAGAVRPPR
jgi:type IV secretory pathway VirB2 component (pilin)